MSTAKKGAVGGQPPRRDIPPVDYHDEISDKQWEKIKELTQDINGPDVKRQIISGIDWPPQS